MHYKRNGRSLIVVSNQPVETVPGRFYKARVWVNPGPGGDYELVADLVRLEDGTRSRSLNEDELMDVIRCAYRARIWIRKHKRRQNWFAFWRRPF